MARVRVTICTLAAIAAVCIGSPPALAFKLHEVNINTTKIFVPNPPKDSNSALMFNNNTKVDQTVQLDVPGVAPALLCGSPRTPCVPTTSWTIPRAHRLQTTIFALDATISATVTSAGGSRRITIEPGTTKVVDSTNYVRKSIPATGTTKTDPAATIIGAGLIGCLLALRPQRNRNRHAEPAVQA